jgi:secondary thiamine-phosphate synthase enzyme
MNIHTFKLQENTKGFCDIVDLTPKVREEITASRFRDGLVTLFVPGSTAALTTVEYEPGLLEDLEELFERLIPSTRRHHHDDRWGDDNGFSHLRASLVGPSLQIPVQAGQLLLGTWQQIILLDFDNRQRRRLIVGQLIGEGSEGSE